MATEGRTFRSKDIGRKRRIWQTANSGGGSVRVESERLAETIRKNYRKRGEAAPNIMHKYSKSIPKPWKIRFGAFWAGS